MITQSVKTASRGVPPSLRRPATAAGYPYPTLPSVHLNHPHTTIAWEATHSCRERNFIHQSAHAALVTQTSVPHPLWRPPEPHRLPSRLCLRLRLFTATMGGGPAEKPEHLLAILPFPEPTAILDRIRKNHPHIQITFRHLQFGTFDEGLQHIPKGEACRLNLPKCSCFVH